MSYRDTIPEHYTGEGDLQPWDVWEAFDLDPWEANAVKYIIRAGLKGPALEDYRKAAHYLQYLIEREENADVVAEEVLADAASDVKSLTSAEASEVWSHSLREIKRILAAKGYGK